jgi:hypothetical protein
MKKACSWHNLSRLPLGTSRRTLRGGIIFRTVPRLLDAVAMLQPLCEKVYMLMFQTAENTAFAVI